MPTEHIVAVVAVTLYLLANIPARAFTNRMILRAWDDLKAINLEEMVPQTQCTGNCGGRCAALRLEMLTAIMGSSVRLQNSLKAIAFVPGDADYGQRFVWRLAPLWPYAVFIGFRARRYVAEFRTVFNFTREDPEQGRPGDVPQHKSNRTSDR